MCSKQSYRCRRNGEMGSEKEKRDREPLLRLYMRIFRCFFCLIQTNFLSHWNVRFGLLVGWLFFRKEIEKKPLSAVYFVYGLVKRLCDMR